MVQAKATKQSSGGAAIKQSKPGMTAGRGLVKFQEGVVVSNKMAKTIVVAVERKIMHLRYGKFVRRTNKFYAHDEKQESKVGDLVRLVETRPMSRLKRWRLKEVLVRAS